MRLRSSILLVLLCMVLLALPAPGAAQTVAQTAAPTFATQFGVPNTTPVKFPALAASGSTVQLAASVRRFDANVWTMQSSASDFGAAIKNVRKHAHRSLPAPIPQRNRL
jgi:cell division septation protein DedD